MKIFSDCAYFALRPFPMQFSSLYKSKSATELRKIHLDDFLKNEKLGFEKLTNYWMKLGFKKIPETDVYLTSSALRTPTEIALFKNRNLP